MADKTKPTLRDIAAQAGVTHSTVSRALRDDPRITAEVKERVRAVARKLGYRRDPRLAELMVHLRRSRHHAHQGTLAWITNLDPADPDMRAIADEFLPTARQHAAELGYHLETLFNITAADATRLGRMFHTRGIHGVWASMYWNVDYDEWKWDWSRFAFIHTGAEPRRRIVDVVDAEDRENIQTLFHTLASRGYRRIGVATTHELESKALFELTAGRVRFSLQDPAHPAFEPCLVKALDAAGARQIDAWIKRHRVDCIVSRWRGMAELLSGLGYRVPRDIGLAHVTVRRIAGPEGLASGIDVNAPLIAATAIDMLASAVEHHRFGLPEIPRQVLVPGRWQKGTTVR
jgi:DNA-binding LacI/PurR family transcriptional regulator